jgi:hypothetical protein
MHPRSFLPALVLALLSLAGGLACLALLDQLGPWAALLSWWAWLLAVLAGAVGLGFWNGRG